MVMCACVCAVCNETDSKTKCKESMHRKRVKCGTNTQNNATDNRTKFDDVYCSLHSSHVGCPIVHISSNWNCKSHMANSIRFRFRKTFIIFDYIFLSFHKIYFVTSFLEIKCWAKIKDSLSFVAPLSICYCLARWLTMITYAQCMLRMTLFPKRTNVHFFL